MAKEFDWDSLETEPTQSAAPTSEASGFDWDSLESDAPASDISKTASAVRGLGQGATFGFADEIAGLGDKAGTWLAKVMAGNDLNEESKAKFDRDVLSKAYSEGRDAYRLEDQKAQKANPMSYLGGNLAGGVASGIATGGTSLGAMTAAGAAQGLGSSEADLANGDVGGALRDTAIGGGLGLGIGKVGQMASKIDLSKALPSLSKMLRGSAGRLAENATGATTSQAARFKPGAGLELLDRGIVGLGDDASNIATKAQAALDSSSDEIGTALSKLDEKGGLSNKGILAELEEMAKSLKQDPSKSALVKQLRSAMDDIAASGEGTTLSQAEKIKRGYQGKVNWNSPESNEANTILSDLYKKNVEGVAKELDPTLANNFTENKELFGLVKPVQEAAERRAITQNQQQFGNLLDLAAGGYGAMNSDNPTGQAALAFAGRRFLLPRAASTAAVAANAGSKIAGNLGKIAAPFMQAGNKALQAASPAMRAAMMPAITKQNVEQAPEKGGSPAPSFSDLSKQQISMSTSAAQQAGYDDLARTLSSLEEKDPVGRNAVMLSIMQNPELRKQYKEINGEE